MTTLPPLQISTNLAAAYIFMDFYVRILRILSASDAAKQRIVLFSAAYVRVSMCLCVSVRAKCREIADHKFM